MDDIDTFAGLMTRLHQGDEVVAAEVYRRFVRRLIALAYRQFDTWIRAKADPEDAVQSAFESFFVRCQRGEFVFGEWDALWALLVLVTVRKCADRVERLGTARRDVAREVSLGDDRAGVIADRVPTPEEAAILTETFANWLDDLGATDRPIIELGLKGWSDREIARELRRSERTVRRVRRRAEDHLRMLCSLDGETESAGVAEERGR